MTCKSCSAAVQAALQAKAGVRSAAVVKNDDTATIEHDESLTVAVRPAGQWHIPSAALIACVAYPITHTGCHYVLPLDS